MEKENKVEKKGKTKLIIIILLVVIVAVVAIAAFFIVTDKSLGDLKTMFQSDEEFTILLDEFVTNLQSPESGKRYLKIQVALMYKDKKNTPKIESNTSKLRDIIVNDLRERTAEEILEVEKTGVLKENILTKVNDSLGEDIIREVYFTNLIVQ